MRGVICKLIREKEYQCEMDKQLQTISEKRNKLFSIQELTENCALSEPSTATQRINEINLDLKYFDNSPLETKTKASSYNSKTVGSFNLNEDEDYVRGKKITIFSPEKTKDLQKSIREFRVVGSIINYNGKGKDKSVYEELLSIKERQILNYSESLNKKQKQIKKIKDDSSVVVSGLKEDIQSLNNQLADCYKENTLLRLKNNTIQDKLDTLLLKHDNLQQQYDRSIIGFINTLPDKIKIYCSKSILIIVMLVMTITGFIKLLFV